jgi:hypothetical protein
MGQKEPEVLHRIQKMLGYGNVRSYHSPKTEGLVWRLDIAREEWMRHFILAVLPYSIVKRKKLREAKRWFESREA